MKQKKIYEEEVEVEESEEREIETYPPDYKITSYGIDFIAASIVSQIQSGDIYIPSFQREFIWDISRSSMFIESLLIGLPVPGIFLSREPDTERFLVIDGQQRLLTLKEFFEGESSKTGKPFVLKEGSVRKDLAGLSYKTLTPEFRRRLNNAILHATIVQQMEPDDKQSAIYLMFERLNTKGVDLTQQEIRMGIYHGEFANLLKEQNLNRNWRQIYGRPINRRYGDLENILRFFAFCFNGAYKKPIKKFMSDFMAENKHLNKVNSSEMIKVFEDVSETIINLLGPDACKPEGRFISAIWDSLSVATANKLKKGPITDKKGYAQAYNNLLKNKDYLDSILAHTSDESRVAKRMKIAEEALLKVG